MWLFAENLVRWAELQLSASKALADAVATTNAILTPSAMTMGCAVRNTEIKPRLTAKA